ncbi:hypothetical protein ACCO45_002888 [Purpureocillium lilacinum]|uniref:Uncharacterized protein n=1 Tax=Purpureocillium lilacinum TaxID=33203 RepID=A0ACC4DY96_PURLI
MRSSSQQPASYNKSDVPSAPCAVIPPRTTHPPHILSTRHSPRPRNEDAASLFIPLAPVQDIDHLVLTCASIPATLTWYTSHLGMQATSFASEADPSVTRHALRFGTHKINLHQRGREFEPKAATALPGTADLCFLIDPGVDLTAVARGFADVGVEVLEGEAWWAGRGRGED